MKASVKKAVLNPSEETAKEANKRRDKALKSGIITKDQYKQNKKLYINLKNNYINEQEYKMALAQYAVQKQKRANKVLYLRDTIGTNNKKYEGGLKAFNNATDYWGNYTITRMDNGQYHVTRTDVYYY